MPGAAPARFVGLWTLRAHFARTRRRQLLEFWDRSERGVGLRFAGQFMLVTSWTYFVSYLLLFVLPLASIGVFKLSQLALGPITVLLAGVQSALIALATKRFLVDTRKAVRFLLIGGVGSFALTMVWTGLVYGAPSHFMASLFGRNWMAARAILPYAGLAVAFASFANAAVSGLRAMRAASENLRLALLMVPFLFIFCLGGAELSGTRGAAGGLAVAGAIYSALSWSLLVKLARTFVPGTSAVVADVVAEVSEP